LTWRSIHQTLLLQGRKHDGRGGERQNHTND
jgi:hypothetical protein